MNFQSWWDTSNRVSAASFSVTLNQSQNLWVTLFKRTGESQSWMNPGLCKLGDLFWAERFRELWTLLKNQGLCMIAGHIKLDTASLFQLTHLVLKELWEGLYSWKSVQVRRLWAWRWASIPAENSRLTFREQWPPYTSRPTTCRWLLTFFRIKFQACKTWSLSPAPSSVMSPHLLFPWRNYLYNLMNTATKQCPQFWAPTDEMSCPHPANSYSPFKFSVSNILSAVGNAELFLCAPFTLISLYSP